MCGCGRYGYDLVAGASPGFDASTLDASLDDASLEDASVAFGPAQLIVELSTPNEEQDPSLTADMLEIVFYRNGDLMTSRRETVDVPWEAPAPIDELNSADDDTSPDLTPDGLVLFFTSNRPGGAGGSDLYMSRRTDRTQPWMPPVRLADVSSPEDDVSAVTDEGLTFLVFTSTRPGGPGGSDLYIAERASTSDPWGPPQLARGLNSGADDIAPFYHEPSRTLFFASSRGAPALDLYAAVRLADGGFGEASPIVELNDSDRQSDPWLSPDGRTMYFSATVRGRSGIYVTTR